MRYEIKKGYIHAFSKGKLKGADIKFSKISVGATENTLMQCRGMRYRNALQRIEIKQNKKNAIQCNTVYYILLP